MYDDYLGVEELGLGGRWGKSGDVVVFPEQEKINRSEHRQNRYTKKAICRQPPSVSPTGFIMAQCLVVVYGFGNLKVMPNGA